MWQYALRHNEEMHCFLAPQNLLLEHSIQGKESYLVTAEALTSLFLVNVLKTPSPLYALHCGDTHLSSCKRTIGLHDILTAAPAILPGVKDEGSTALNLGSGNFKARLDVHRLTG